MMGRCGSSHCEWNGCAFPQDCSAKKENKPTSIDDLKIEKRFLKRCGDCGQFVKRNLWLDKQKHPKAVHALCTKCKDNYDDCRDH